VEHEPRRSIKVEDVMRPAVSVTPETTAREVLKILRDNNVPGVPVVNESGRSELAVAHKMVHDGVSSVVITDGGSVVGIVNRLDLYAAIEGID
jgi:CBS domain-containing protein